jgi:ABC-type nitrate/sulfonate/bicarbonate transport system substrate-binding protein
MGTVLGAAPAAARVALPAVHLGRRTYRVAWNGGHCEAPAYAAYAKHLWAREGIDVELYHLAGADAADALRLGKIDAAPSILYYWLKHIEQGVDVRVAAGLHGGCTPGQDDRDRRQRLREKHL